MAHPGPPRGKVRRSPERGPGRLGASLDPITHALPRPQHGGSRAFCSTGPGAGERSGAGLAASRTPLTRANAALRLLVGV